MNWLNSVLTSKTCVWCFNFIYMLTMWLILNLRHGEGLKKLMNEINGVLKWLCSLVFFKRRECSFFFSLMFLTSFVCCFSCKVTWTPRCTANGSCEQAINNKYRNDLCNVLVFILYIGIFLKQCCFRLNPLLCDVTRRLKESIYDTRPLRDSACAHQ